MLLSHSSTTAYVRTPARDAIKAKLLCPRMRLSFKVEMHELRLTIQLPSRLALEQSNQCCAHYIWNLEVHSAAHKLIGWSFECLDWSLPDLRTETFSYSVLLT